MEVDEPDEKLLRNQVQMPDEKCKYLTKILVNGTNESKREQQALNLKGNAEVKRIEDISKNTTFFGVRPPQETSCKETREDLASGTGDSTIRSVPGPLRQTDLPLQRWQGDPLEGTKESEELPGLT